MPRAVIDAAGVVHVVYFEGVMSGGELLHVARAPGAPDWTRPVQVNSQPRSAVGMGPMDGGQVALGPRGRLHVVWFQTNPNRIFYARGQPDGDGFEPQRTLWQEAQGRLEAGPAVAADAAGNVFVFWHAGAGEDAERAVHALVSRDGGDTFGAARRVSKADEGACGCCNLAALAVPGGSGPGLVPQRARERAARPAPADLRRRRSDVRGPGRFIRGRSGPARSPRPR